MLHLLLWTFGFLLTALDLYSQSPAITNISQVRLLSPDEAARNLSVEFRATVVFATHLGNVFVHDDREGIYVSREKLSGSLSPGDVIKVCGVTGTGDYAPIVQAESTESLGKGPLPTPMRVSFDDLGSSRFDCQWLEVEGVVRSVAALATNRCELELAVQGGRLRVYLLDCDPGVTQNLVDSRVRVTGARGCIFNQKRQFLAPLLFVNSERLQIISPAPVDPFAGPVRAVSSLLQFAPHSRENHRIKVRGVVTHNQPGAHVFLREGGQGLRLNTREATDLVPGDIVEALGFQTVGSYTPYLEDTSFRKVGRALEPAPARVSFADAIEGHHAADLITLEGRLVNSVQRGDETILVLQREGSLFQALLPRRDDSPLNLPNGSDLEVTGICLVQNVTEQRSTVKPESISILLRSAADVVLLKGPSWWTPRTLLWTLAGVTTLFLAVLGAVLGRSRLRLREQSRARAEAEARLIAIMAERNRMAREIHDTLAQGFTAISVQLEALKDKVSNSPQAAKHLELARTFVRSSLAEARRSIWDMRSQALEQADLPTALSSLANQLTSGTSVAVQLNVRGVVRRLPVTVENNLLRIGQEAITNSVKHSQARTIAIDFEFRDRSVLLRVKDDGVGFNSGKITGGASGGFGLVGMRERAQPLSARLTIKSEIGCGAEIEVEAPAP